ncbi:hypothetical protein KIM372_14700 [Bombiscardovia nodaiensis]|uniref:Uncharacterized protein n=1 Tax=Bombiscardovia nodaiensis TaxID=2932181 RepID=A0ABN6SDH5_9BIFI|nr:hypothetical protein KIM372_14700 [Bombiscardovia nodaiensis]
MVSDRKVLEFAAAPTGRGLDQEAYWQSLEKSFSEDFIQAARARQD